MAAASASASATGAGAAPPAEKKAARTDSLAAPKAFNLKEYANQYTGIVKVYRLLHIAERSHELSLEAYRLAISELKKGLNTNYYTEAVAKAREIWGDRLGDEWGLDAKWVANTNRSFTEKLTRLEANLSAARRDGEKDATRKAYDELASHYVSRGDFTSALTKYLDSKDASGDTLDTCLSIIRSSIYLASMSDVQNQVSRAKNLHGQQLHQSPVKTAIVNASAGLQFLRSGSYRMAAQSFLQCTPDIEGQFNEVLTGKDVAAYGSLTALASYSRHDLKDSVLNNPRFKGFLEAAPVWRKIITDFQASKYKECFHSLLRVRDECALDYYLGPHVQKLIGKIYDRAISQYFRPFTAVKLQAMAAAFNMDVPSLERSLAYLIADGKIQARIDSHSKVLIARHADQRSSTYETAMALGNKYVRDAKALLMRLSLVENEFVVKHPEQRRRKEDDDGPRGPEGSDRGGGGRPSGR